jgi:hypothetical protein
MNLEPDPRVSGQIDSWGLTVEHTSKKLRFVSFRSIKRCDPHDRTNLARRGVEFL